MQLQKVIRQFLEHCEIEKGHSNLTLRNYNHYLNRFQKYCESENTSDIEDVDLDLIRKYRLWLNRQKGKDGDLCKQTQNYHLIALRAMLKYCAKQDINTLPAEKIELADTPEREIEILEPEEVERLLNAPNLSNISGMRDKAIIELLFSTGLRLSEMVSLDRENVNLDTGEFSVRGKGGKIRVVFLSDRAKEFISLYLTKRNDSDGALFVRHGKGGAKTEDDRLSPRQIQRVVNIYSKKAGIMKPVHPHTLRHSFATDLLQGGADLRSVQTLLGHSSVTTTQIYTHITNPQLKEIHKKYHGKKLTYNEE